jgi:hypothetical protein
MQNTSDIQRQLNQVQQNVVDADLLTGIYYYDNPRLDESIKEGANINAIGVGWFARDKPTTFSPLAMAVKINNQYAVQRLLEEGADVYGKTEQGQPTMGEAVKRGNYRIVQALLMVDPNLATVPHCNSEQSKGSQLHNAVFSLYPYQIINESTWNQNNQAAKQLLIDYYEEKKVILPKKLTAVYEGNLDMVKVLAQYPDMAMTKCEGENSFSPLEGVYDPRKYKQYFFDANGSPDPKNPDAIECLTKDNDPNPHILTFRIHLADRSDANPIPVTLTVDFTKLQIALQKMAESSPIFITQRANQLAEENRRLAEESRQLQHRLAAVHAQFGGLAVTVQKHSDVVGVDKIADFQRFQAAIASHENAKAFFKYIEIGLGAFHNYCTNVQGGGSPKEGSLELAASILEIGSGLIGTIPVVGSFLEKFTNVSSSFLRKVDKERETNIAKRVASLGTMKDMAQVFQTVAHQLTECCFQPLVEILATADEAKGQYTQLQQMAAKTKKAVLKEQPLSPAQQLAATAVMCMIDEVLVSGDKITPKTSNEQLANILLNAVINRKVASSDDALGKFWEAMLSKLQRDGLRTKKGTIVNPVNILGRSGIMANNQFYMNQHLDFMQFGWRNLKLKSVEFEEVSKNLNLHLIGAPSKLPRTLDLEMATSLATSTQPTQTYTQTTQTYTQPYTQPTQTYMPAQPLTYGFAALSLQEYGNNNNNIGNSGGGNNNNRIGNNNNRIGNNNNNNNGAASSSYPAYPTYPTVYPPAYPATTYPPAYYPPPYPITPPAQPQANNNNGYY